MNTLKIITGILTILMTSSTLICGMWIKTNQITDAGSLKFHMTSGIISLVLLIIFFILVLVKK